MDSYEWSSGYGPKFGLFSVDFASKGLERTPRESVAVFASIAGAQADALDSRPALYSAFSRAGARSPTLDEILSAANRTASRRPARQAGAHQRAQLQLLDQAGSTRQAGGTRVHRAARKRAASPSLEPGGKTLSYKDFAATFKHSAAMHS